MNGYVIVVCGIVIFSITHTFGTFLVAKLLSAQPTHVDLGLGPKPFHFRLARTTFNFGPLPFGGAVGFADANGNDMAWLSLNPVRRIAIVLLGLALPIGLGALFAGQNAPSIFYNTFGDLLMLLFQIKQPLNIAGSIESVHMTRGLATALGLVVLKVAAVNALPLPPFSGFSLTQQIWRGLAGRNFPTTIFQMLFKLTAILLLMLATIVLWRTVAV
jgi:membrane-associated protease RseP (regulator of RpoE activity)